MIAEELIILLRKQRCWSKSWRDLLSIIREIISSLPLKRTRIDDPDGLREFGSCGESMKESAKGVIVVGVEAR